jgi:RNA polymerase sigma factor (sigma-70 family)
VIGDDEKPSWLTREQKEKLAAQAMVRVRRLAARQQRRAPWMELMNLVSIGYTEMSACLTTFRPSDASFETYMYPRVCGEMRDQSEAERKRLERLGEMREVIAESRGLVPMGHADAAEADYLTTARPNPKDDVGDVRQAARGLTRFARGHAASLALGYLGSSFTTNPEEALSGRERTEALRRAIKTLPAREARAVELYFFEGSSLDVTAERLGVSKRSAQRFVGDARDRLEAICRARGLGPA